MKTMLISILCLLALIAGAASMVTNPAAPMSTSIEANRKECLNAINECRRKVQPQAANMLEVKWSPDAAVTALNYAKQCPYLVHSKVEQRTLPANSAAYECGENMFHSSYLATWTEVIGAFCNESKDFIFSVGPKAPGLQVGHFTQLAWWRSFLAGCDVYYCPQNPLPFIYMCHHCPPGNVGDKLYKPYVIGKPCEKCPNACNNGLCTNPCYYNLESSLCEGFKQYCFDASVRKSCPGTCGCTNGEIV